MQIVNHNLGAGPEGSGESRKKLALTHLQLRFTSQANDLIRPAASFGSEIRKGSVVPACRTPHHGIDRKSFLAERMPGPEGLKNMAGGERSESPVSDGSVQER